MSYQKGFQGQGTARPAVAKQAPSNSNSGAKSGSSLEKITGMFPTDKENAFEVRITDEIHAALQNVASGSYLKAFVNVSEKTGKQYVTLAVKPYKAKQA